MGRTLLGLAGLNLRSAMNDFFVRSQVLHETVILSLVKSAIHIYMVILFSLLSLAALSFYGPRIQLLYPWQLSTTTFAMCSENQGCNLCSTLKEPLAVPNSHKNISIINDIQKLQISDKPWHSRPQVSKSTSNTHYIGKSKAKLFFFQLPNDENIFKETWQVWSRMAWLHFWSNNCSTEPSGTLVKQLRISVLPLMCARGKGQGLNLQLHNMHSEEGRGKSQARSLHYQVSRFLCYRMSKASLE